MPFSVWLTSHRRIEDVRAGAPDRLTLEDLRACLELLARSRPTRAALRPDGSTWVFRAGEELALAPLLWAGLRPNNGPQAGTLQLSVSATHPFFAEVEWMASVGITTGTAASPKPLYNPSAAVSRGAMSAFMFRLADGPGVGVGP